MFMRQEMPWAKSRIGMGGMAKQDTQYIPKFKSATAPGLALAREPLDESIAATRHEQCWMSPYPCDWALGLLLRPTGRRSLLIVKKPTDTMRHVL